jgi:hypothetical protein
MNRVEATIGGALVGCSAWLVLQSMAFACGAWRYHDLRAERWVRFDTAANGYPLSYSVSEEEDGSLVLGGPKGSIRFVGQSLRLGSSEIGELEAEKLTVGRRMFRIDLERLDPDGYPLPPFRVTTWEGERKIGEAVAMSLRNCESCDETCDHAGDVRSRVALYLASRALYPDRGMDSKVRVSPPPRTWDPRFVR